MERTIQQLRQTIATARPWVLIAVIAAAGLSLFVATQGARYYLADRSNTSVLEEIGRLERSIGEMPDGSAQQDARLEIKILQLESVQQKFDYPATDTLMSIVSDVAGDAGLDLVSMAAEDVSVELRGTLQYQVHPIAVVVDGPTANVQEFLEKLYDRVPVVVASNTRIVNLDADPSTQVRLRFYLSPEVIREEEATEEEAAEETAG